MVAFQQTISNNLLEKTDTNMRFSLRFREHRSSEDGQPESPMGAIQLGPPDKPAHPPKPDSTKPVKRTLRDGLSGQWNFDNSEVDSSPADQNQYGPPNKPIVPPSNPPRPPKN